VHRDAVARSLERLQLAVGRDVDALERAHRHENAELQVYDRALNMLAFRARASVELSRALVRKGASRAVAIAWSHGCVNRAS